MTRGGAVLAAAFAASPLFAAGEDPRQLLAQLEARLLEARQVVVEGHIQSSGFVHSELRGRAEVGEGNRIDVAYAGQFAGKPQDLALKANGRTLTLRNGGETRRDDVSAESNRAVLIGLLRMGLLHNLARLTVLQGPDHAAGGVEQWVTLDNFRATTYALGGEMEGVPSVGFDVLVDGQPAASARLWLDPATGLPRRREQTVHFRQGDMKVIEEYGRFVLE